MKRAMETMSSYKFVLVGIFIRLLRNVTANSTGKWVAGHLDSFTGGLSQVGFRVSLAFSVNSRFEEIKKNLSEVNDQIIGDHLAKEINSYFGEWEAVVFAESSTINTYLLPQRRYDTDILLKNPDKCLTDGNFDKLSDIAQSDIASACRCILFGEATAAAFHILRGTEEVLRQYYKHHIRSRRMSNPMWGPMITALKAKSRLPPPSALLDTLDLIRESYRNPTQHPEKLYSIDEAQDLFGLCITVINQISDELPNMA